MPPGDWIFFSRQMGKCSQQKVSIKFFPHSKTQTRDVFQDVSLYEKELFPHLNNFKSQIPQVKALKYHVACDIVEMQFLSNRQLP